jgi:acid stress-induced BolA-like protein IbaG/YrbA
MREQIHALSMKTLTPAEYSAQGNPAETHHQ